MVTKRNNSQRIGILIIAIVMVVSTIAMFAGMMLMTRNDGIDQQRIERLEEDYRAEYSKYQERVEAQAAELSEQYYDEFSKYESRVAKFDADSVDELSIRDLEGGDGKKIDGDEEYSAYYIGWTPDGEVFDQSIDGDSLKVPLTGGGDNSLIEGWDEGVVGMKVGGVREITIPSDMAYGEMGSGDGGIEPDTPIKFVIMVIPTPEQIEEPEIPEELMTLYSRQM